jgi:hypothetical protein
MKRLLRMTVPGGTLYPATVPPLAKWRVCHGTVPRSRIVSLITQVRYESEVSCCTVHKPLLGLAASSSRRSVRSMSGFWYRNEMANVAVNAVVSVPPTRNSAMSAASAKRRATDQRTQTIAVHVGRQQARKGRSLIRRGWSAGRLTFLVGRVRGPAPQAMGSSAAVWAGRTACLQSERFAMV